jgi:hypothetical protein
MLPGLTMSYKIEIKDEYSFGRWFSHHLRFPTKLEAEECLNHFAYTGSCGITDLRVVKSCDSVNARWTEKGVTDKDGRLPEPPPPPTPEEIRSDADRLSTAWNAIVARMDASPKRGQKKNKRD